ncbi:hypothetical protein HJC23_013373 [Cyclotella cryptica]|uniref:Cystatin domain-containing protein n=1 Tax=Cyclotella cryptica TaxID=29204 RepID=A0ABD3P9C5_9STRA
MLSLTLLVIAALTIQSPQAKASIDDRDYMRSGPQQTFDRSRKTSMVGGFSALDSKSDEISSIASFALAEFAAMSQKDASNAASTPDSFVVLPSQVQSGEISTVVLEAQRQVVAGMNYKLTIGLIQNNQCLGGFKATVWKQLSGELKVATWGVRLGCDEINAQFGEAIGEVLKGEANALRVEEEVEIQKGEVEPNE